MEWHFVSAPKLRPMKVAINVHQKRTDSGYILVAPYTTFGSDMVGQSGSLMMDENGNPIWFRPLKNRFIQNTDFRVQILHGRPVITMWQGTISGTQSASPNLPDGNPEPGAFFLIFNKHYQVIKKVKAKRGYTSDVHEFTITKNNTALFTALKQVPADLTKYGGPKKGFIDNYCIQEINLKTGKLIFYWTTLDHINPADSMLPASSALSTNNVWDCFHMNSVSEGPNSTLLVSLRNMWTIYHIKKESGHILWQLGGILSDFTISPDSKFSWQHHARFRSDDTISLFDDACCASDTSPPQGQARGLILKLDYKKKTAHHVHTYYHDPTLIVGSQGNMELLPNGNQFVGWGQQGYASEFAYDGNHQHALSKNMLYDIAYPGDNISYRAFKNKWIGIPLDRPKIAAIKSDKKLSIFMSWNGSTQTCAWQILAGKKPQKMRIIISSTPRNGFETKVDIHSAGPYFQVRALDSSGKILRSSKIIKGIHTK